MLVAFELLVDPSNHLLVGFLLPDAVTTHYNEVSSSLEWVLIDVRVGSDSLLLRGEVLLALVLQVTESSS